MAPKAPPAAATTPTADLNPKALRIVMVPAAHLRPAEYNPRKWSEDQKVNLKRSIAEHGLVDPIIVNSNPARKNIIIGGHFRLECAREIGYTEVPVVFIDIADLDTEKKLNLRLNHSTGEFDWNLLGEYFTEDLLLDVGFTQDELNLNLDFETPDFGNKDMDDVPSGRPTTIKCAEMFSLGGHFLICGDATDILLLDKLMRGTKANMLFADPPYGVSISEKNKLLNKVNTGNGGNTTAIENDNLDADKLQKVLLKVFGNCREHMDSKSASFYVTAPNSGELGIMMMTMLRDSGLPSRHTLLWVKNQATFSMGRLDYEYQHEPIYYGWLGSHKFYKNGEHNTTTWFIDKPTASKEHPTMKPVELVENALLNSTAPGDVVLDPFCGSGTTMIAAEKTGRRCYAVELMPSYCQVTIDRWEQLTGKKAVKV